MEYKISKLKPPVYDECVRKFSIKVTFESGLIFAYYPYIHSYKGNLRKDLVVHESVHLERQKEIGVEIWWDHYLNEEQFRFREEVLAYRAQYQWIIKNTGRGTHFFWLRQFADDMCKIYGFTNPNLINYMNIIKGRD